ncbi:MAG: MFS transporter [Candidatus Gastranaerophilales bacterium]|nr:MFS transporter [Candidatus Gastranaerophilales bacterium]
MAKSDKRAILGLSMGHFAADLYSSAIIPLYPLITQKLGITLASISLIISLGHLVSSMLQPLFGFFSDRMKRRAFMINGLIMGAIFIPLTITASNSFLLCLFLMLGMCGNALFHPQVTSLVKTFCFNNPNVIKYMGIFMGLGTIGYSLGPVISSNLVEKFGEGALLYITVLGLLTALVLYFVVPKIPAGSINKTKESFFAVMKEIVSNKVCMMLAWIATVKSAVSISYGTYIPFILKDYGFSLDKIGLIVTLFYILSGVSMILSAKAEEKIGAVNIIRLSFFMILPLSLLFCILANINILWAVFVFIISGFFINLSVSVTIVAAQKLVPAHSGVISGIMQGFSWGLGALSLVPMGYLGEICGIMPILIIMASIAFLTGIFGLTKKVREVL